MAFNSKLFDERLKIVTGQTTKRTIAEELGVSPSTISHWTSDNTAAQPTAEQLIAIASRYNCSIDFLLGNDRVDRNWDNLSPQDVCRIINKLHQEYELSPAGRSPDILGDKEVGLYFPDKRYGLTDKYDLSIIRSFIREYYSRAIGIFNPDTLDGITEELISKETIIARVVSYPA